MFRPNRHRNEPLKETPLNNAVRANNVELVKTLVQAGASINTAVFFSGTPLHCAAERGNVEILTILINAGADVNAKDTLVFSPLHKAVEKENVEIVKVLIEAGADVNAKNQFGSTPLHQAGKSNNVEIVKELIRASADVNIEDSDSSTPLHGAAETGNVEIVKALMKAGANANAKHYWKGTPVHLAAKRCSVNAPLDKLTKFPVNDLSCVQVMIKYSLLHCHYKFHSSMSDDSCKTFDVLPEFSKACLEQVTAMSKDLITDEVSLCDYLKNTESSHKIQCSIAGNSCISDVILQRVLSMKYPLYCDVLCESLGRSYFEEKFVTFKLCSKLVSLETTQREIILDACFMKAIAKYLPLLDLATFVFSFSIL